MKGVLQSLKSEILKRLCEGCEGFLFKIPGKARVRARVNNAFRQTTFLGREQLDAELDHLMHDKVSL